MFAHDKHQHATLCFPCMRPYGNSSGAFSTPRPTAHHKSQIISRKRTCLFCLSSFIKILATLCLKLIIRSKKMEEEEEELSTKLLTTVTQARHARSMLHFLKETLNSMQLPPFSADLAFTIADLGCSCGPNTLFNMDIIVKHVTKIYETFGHEAPEFQVYFSDLPSNDFNTLFQLLPPLTSNSSLEESLAAIDEQQRSYYAAGVPGSFYGRLFPARSIDVFHSTFSLHWLSQVSSRVLNLFNK